MTIGNKEPKLEYNKSKRIRFLLIRDLILFVIGVIYVIVVINTGVYIPCIFYKVTGFKCPGCGVAHMCVSMLRFDMRNAFISNPLLFMLWPVVLYLIVKSDYNYVNKRTYRLSGVDMWLLNVTLALFLTYWVVRNILHV